MNMKEWEAAGARAMRPRTQYTVTTYSVQQRLNHIIAQQIFLGQVPPVDTLGIRVCEQS